MHSPRTDEPSTPSRRRLAAVKANGHASDHVRANGVEHALTTLPASPFERVFTIGRKHGLAILLASIFVAGVVHGGGGEALARKSAAWVAARRAEAEAQVDTIDIDVTEPPKPEEPPPPPPPEPEPVPTAPQVTAPNAPVEAKPNTEAPAPPLAGVGNLLTADDKNAQNADDKDVPEFLTDPNGKEYVGGNSVVGGGDQVGKEGGKKNGVPCGGVGQPPCGTGEASKGPLAAPPPPPPKPAVDLSRPPSVPNANICKNYFPADADDDSAFVQVLVKVEPTGKVTSATVLVEDPKGQGFGRQARTCLLSSKLNPALDASGQAVGQSIAIGVHFTRY